jgi:hypothetical protein
VIEALEQALLDRARTLVAPFGLVLEPFPEDPDAYTMTHPKGAVLVVYKGSTYGQALATDAMVQTRAMGFELVILVRNLRKHQGAYGVIDALRQGLAGWQPPQAGRAARITRDEFRGREGSVWQWAVAVEIPALSIPIDPVEDVMGILKDTTFYPEFP